MSTDTNHRQRGRGRGRGSGRGRGGPRHPHQQQQQHPHGGGEALTPSAFTMQPQQYPMGTPWDPQFATAGNVAANSGALQTGMLPHHGWGEYYAPDGTPYYYNSITHVSQWEKPQELVCGEINEPSALHYSTHPTTAVGNSTGVPISMTASVPMHGMPVMIPHGASTVANGVVFDPTSMGEFQSSSVAGLPTSHPADMNSTRDGNQHMQAAAVAPIGPGPPIQKTEEAQGPPGCNLFIFHIPNDMTNRDLFNYFSAYGNVISARIMVERETGRSRGFGFVSFDNKKAAEDAIEGMNGFQIGKKRLKVQYKDEKKQRR